MPESTRIQTLLEPVDDASDVDLPLLFAEAQGHVRAAIVRCDTAGIPSDSIIAALMTELMPRLVQAYEPSAVAAVLNQLADEISTTGRSH